MIDPDVVRALLPIASVGPHTTLIAVGAKGIVGDALRRTVPVYTTRPFRTGMGVKDVVAALTKVAAVDATGLVFDTGGSSHRDGKKECDKIFHVCLFPLLNVDGRISPSGVV